VPAGTLAHMRAVSDPVAAGVPKGVRRGWGSDWAWR